LLEIGFSQYQIPLPGFLFFLFAGCNPTLLFDKFLVFRFHKQPTECATPRRGPWPDSTTEAKPVIGWPDALESLRFSAGPGIARIVDRKILGQVRARLQFAEDAPGFTPMRDANPSKNCRAEIVVRKSRFVFERSSSQLHRSRRNALGPSIAFASSIESMVSVIEHP
jgi:hypothetical protein